MPRARSRLHRRTDGRTCPPAAHSESECFDLMPAVASPYASFLIPNKSGRLTDYQIVCPHLLVPVQWTSKRAVRLTRGGCKNSLLKYIQVAQRQKGSSLARLAPRWFPVQLLTGGRRADGGDGGGGGGGHLFYSLYGWLEWQRMAAVAVTVAAQCGARACEREVVERAMQNLKIPLHCHWPTSSPTSFELRKRWPSLRRSLRD